MHNRKKKRRIPSLAPAVHIYIHLANTWKNFCLIHSWMSGGGKWIPDRFILRYCYNSWQSQPSWWHIVSVVLCLSCTMSLWDGKDKDMGFRNCFFPDDLCEGLHSVHGTWCISDEGREGCSYFISGRMACSQWSQVLQKHFFLIMNGNMASLWPWSTVTALHRPVFG